MRLHRCIWIGSAVVSLAATVSCSYGPEDIGACDDETLLYDDRSLLVHFADGTNAVGTASAGTYRGTNLNPSRHSFSARVPVEKNCDDPGPSWIVVVSVAIDAFDAADEVTVPVVAPPPEGETIEPGQACVRRYDDEQRETHATSGTVSIRLTRGCERFEGTVDVVPSEGLAARFEGGIYAGDTQGLCDR